MLDFTPNNGQTLTPAQPPHARRSAQLPDDAEHSELVLITRDLAAKMDALTALLVIWSVKEKRLRALCACGGPHWGDLPWLPARRSGFAGRVFVSGRTLAGRIVGDRDPYLIAEGRPGVTYAVGAAVSPPHGPRGAMCVGLQGKPNDSRAARWTVESYARIAALCLRGSTALTGLLAAAHHDTLTGCLNYAAIHSELEREVARSARYARTLSVCFIDMDGFKQVNDHHGHPQGSRLLAEIATSLRSDVRIGDSVGRYGGDEFIVLLPDTDEAAAHPLAERLRKRLCTVSVERGYERLNASIGVAAWEAGMTADELLAAADRAQGTAKRLGGGLVVGATDAATGAGRDVAPATARPRGVISPSPPEA